MTKAATIRKPAVSHIQRKLIPSYIFLTIMSILSVFPLYWMFTAATNTSLEVAQGKVWFGNYLAENYKNLIDQQNLWQAMGNSFFYAIVQTLATLLICSLAGYGFELYHDRGKDRLFAILLLAMMVPQVASGCFTPRPRKDRVDSIRMTPPMPMVACTISWGITLGTR